MRFAAPLLPVVVLLAVAPSASAATLTTDSRCYQETEEVVINGSGYKPNSFVTISREGRAIGSAGTSAAGAFRVKFPTQELRGKREALFALTATDGTAAAVARYRVTKVFADFAPNTGNPSTLRVRFTALGFGVMRANAHVYLHYVRPSGSVRRTIRLGKSRGTCGVIRRTARRLLFPFSAQRGRWILQFDTNRRYRRGRPNSDFVWVRKPVQVFNRG